MDLACSLDKEELKKIIVSNRDQLALYGLAVIQCNRVEFFLEHWAPFKHFLYDISEYEIIEECHELNEDRKHLDHGVLTKEGTGKEQLIRSGKKGIGIISVDLNDDFLWAIILKASKIIIEMCDDFRAAIPTQKVKK
jgi:hypothetical protein